VVAVDLSRAKAILLFLPVPIVLWLFTRAPLGVPASFGLGVVLMTTHRLYARPFALRLAGARCLWCGRASDRGPRLELRDPLGVVAWRACGAPHADLVARLVTWADAHAAFLKVGILGTLVLFLPLSLLADRGRLGPVTYPDAVALFRLGIAISVLTLALRFRAAVPAPVERLRSPFPLHLQALIGSVAVLWLFRLVGLAWLGLAVGHGFRRAGLA
jgi:hypothetical protein